MRREKTRREERYSHNKFRNREDEENDEREESRDDIEDEFDFEADLDIDKFRLDLECILHPTKYMKYAKAAAKANKRARIAEERVKTIRSELVNKAKQTDAGKNATTLEAYYRTNPAYKKAKEAWVEAQFEADLLTGAVFAMQAKKGMIESMVKLHGQEYYSTPTIDNESAEKFNELKQRSARSKIRDRLKR